jgi:hypothetical protein
METNSNMANDTAQMNLREPDKTDWDNYNAGSKFMAPPPALDEAGNMIVYTGVIEGIKEEANQYAVDKEGNAYLNYTFDPIRLVGAGVYDGYTIRFTSASLKPFEKNGEPIKGNPSKLGNALRSAGMTSKPQTNAEWRAAVNQLKGKKVMFTIDWEAKNKEAGEVVKGFLAFPTDPDRPGTRKAILKAGDTVTERDNKGNVLGHQTISSEVMFANARLKFFKDPPNQARR